MKFMLKPILKYSAFLLLFVTIFVQFPSRVFATDLTTSLTSYWKLDEASGARADSVGTNNLTSNNTVGQAVGKLTNAAQFNSASSRYLSITDNASISVGDIDFTVGAWVYLDSKSADQAIAGQYYTTTNQRSWNINYQAAADRFRFAVSADGTSVAGQFDNVIADNFGSPSTGTWYYIVAWHDSVANTINISVNNGPANSLSHTTGVLDSTGPFTIGALGNPLQYFDGRIDGVGLWKRVLTSQERTNLYNSGNGLEYPFTSVSSDATISAGTLASQALAGTFTGGANIGASSALTVTVPDASKTNATLALTKGNANSVIKYVKGSQPSVDGDYTNTYSSGSTQITVANNDIIWLLVTAEDTTTKLYYKITVTVTPPVSDSIVITTPVSYRVFQRNGSNQGNISIAGTYTGSPTAIEASWNGGAYSTIVVSPTGGTFSGTLSNQTAGQGTLTVRFTNNTSVSTTKNYVGIGDIFVIAGQSNASGRAINSQVYSSPTYKAVLFGNDDVWKELVDPTDDNAGQIDSVSLENVSVYTTGFGSAWPLVATLYMQNQNVPVAFIPTAKGGTSITQWQPNVSNHGDTSTLYGSMYRRINAVGGSVKAILFWQGEDDVIAGTSRSTYLTKITSFANYVYNDFGVKTIAAQIGPYGNQTTTNIDNVRLAQIDAWNAGGNILAGPSLYDVQLTADTTYYVHFKTDSEILTVANRWWSAIQKDLYSGSDGRGPILTAAEYNSAKTQIRLTFSDDTLPILPASGLAGFAIKDNGTPVSISSVTRISNSKLQINLTSAANGSLTVSLGSGNTGEGVVVPTDSSTYNLPAEIFVDQATTLLAHTITASAGANGSISSSGATSVNDGADQSFTITPAAHYHVADILVDSVSVGAVSSYTFNNVTADHTISATFAIDTKTLTYTAGSHGSITGTNPQTVNYGADGSAVTAVADTGYHFVNWSDDSTTNPRTDTNITDNISVTANFAINTYTLTYNAGTHGTITGTTPQTVNYGSDGSAVTAVADPGYHFTSWDDGGLTASRTDTNITANHTYTASFEATAPTTYTITASAGSNGSISPSGATTVNSGDNQTFTITANSNYHISDITVDGSSVGAVSSYTFSNVTATHTISATFAVTSSGGGGCYNCYVNPAVPSGGFKMSINGGVSTTSNRNVFLGFNAGADIKKIAISMTGDFTDASQENYVASKQWDLCSKLGGAVKNPTCLDGKYTVYAKFYTAYGRSSDTSIASSTITLKSSTTSFENMQQYTNLPFTNPFTKYLQYRQTNADIKRLQIFLNSDPDTRVANSGAGSPGKETNFFGLLTKKAVIKFQEKYAKDILDPRGFKKGTGYIGKTTLAKINELMGNK